MRYLVDASDLDTMTELAGLLPATYPVEVRPVLELGDHDDGARH